MPEDPYAVTKWEEALWWSLGVYVMLVIAFCVCLPQEPPPHNYVPMPQEPSWSRE